MEVGLLRKTVDANNKMQFTFQVLHKWYQRNILSVKDPMTEMVTWQQNRYLDPGVWEYFKSKINPAALPTNISSLQLPAPPAGPRPLQMAFMVNTLIYII